MTASQSQPSKRARETTAKAQVAGSTHAATLLAPQAEKAVRRAVRSLDLVLQADPTGVRTDEVAPRLVRRARVRTVAALDAVLAGDNPLWAEDTNGLTLGDLDYSLVEGLLSDSLIDYLEDHGHTPPPSASDLVDDVSAAIALMQSESESHLGRNELSRAARDRLQALRSAVDGLDLTPGSTSPLLLKAKKVFAAVMMGTVALGGQVVEGVAVDMVKDVVKASAFYSIVEPDEVDRDDAVDRADQLPSDRESLEIAILRAELRKAEAEALIAERSAAGGRS
jgi:hypothetical protein